MYVDCRAQQFEHSHELTQIYEIDERIQQEVGKSLGRRAGLVHVVQLRTGPSDFAHDTSNGEWNQRSCVESVRIASKPLSKCCAVLPAKSLRAPHDGAKSFLKGERKHEPLIE